MELRELAFYGGIAAMVIAVLLGAIVVIVFKLRSAALKRVLDAEYGEQDKSN